MGKQKSPEGADARLGAGGLRRLLAQSKLGFVFAQSCHSAGLVFTLTVSCYMHANRPRLHYLFVTTSRFASDFILENFFEFLKCTVCQQILLTYKAFRPQSDFAVPGNVIPFAAINDDCYCVNRIG